MGQYFSARSTKVRPRWLIAHFLLFAALGVAIQVDAQPASAADGRRLKIVRPALAKRIPNLFLQTDDLVVHPRKEKQGVYYAVLSGKLGSPGWVLSLNSKRRVNLKNGEFKVVIGLRNGWNSLTLTALGPRGVTRTERLRLYVSRTDFEDSGAGRNFAVTIGSRYSARWDLSDAPYSRSTVMGEVRAIYDVSDVFGLYLRAGKSFMLNSATALGGGVQVYFLRTDGIFGMGLGSTFSTIFYLIGDLQSFHGSGPGDESYSKAISPGFGAGGRLNFGTSQFFLDGGMIAFRVERWMAGAYLGLGAGF